ncbi:MAG: DUF2336 domain-containing protein [Alphaproteobacteria bacterium]|nr:DUF2336 domain-containing protein [Alphaproteobacteria bacterium]
MRHSATSKGLNWYQRDLKGPTNTRARSPPSPRRWPPAAGSRAFVIAALAYGASVAEGVVEKAATLQNGKALVALAWKAGFSMALAVRLQTQLAGIPPSGALAEVEGRG